MSPALEQLRNVIAAPTLKGILAVIAVLWAEAAHSASDGFLISFGAVALLFFLDGMLGTWQAVANGEFSKSRLTRWISKFLSYSGLALVAFVAGTLSATAIAVVVPTADGLQGAYLLTTAVNTALAGTEAISILGHVNRLSDGALENLPIMAYLRPLLEQMRDWTPAPQPKAAPNGGP